MLSGGDFWIATGGRWRGTTSSSAGNASGSFGYSNRQLAPLTLTSRGRPVLVRGPSASRQRHPDGDDYTLQRRDRELSVDAVRLFYDNPVSLGFALVESYRPDDPAVLVPLLRLAGPHLSAAYPGHGDVAVPGREPAVLRVDRRGGVPDRLELRRLRLLRSARRGGRHRAVAALPAPHADVRRVARGMAGAPTGERLLRVGGYVLEPLARRADQPERTVADYPFLPPGALFVESLRGFEDYPFAVDRIAIGSALYRLPVIIDHGWASTLWLLPSLFIRQINVDLFAAGASDGYSNGRHSAAGGSLTLFTALWVVPISLRYQLARRFTDDQALVHLVQLGL